jgi:hypothetical protein
MTIAETDTRRIQALITARDAAVLKATSRYRAVTTYGFNADGTHIRPRTSTLSLCRNITSTRAGNPLRLEDVTCAACLDAFTEATRP